MIPHPPWTVETLSAWLFETDPQNTCCKENDCFDEYDRVAASAIELIAEGASPDRAVANALKRWFESPASTHAAETMEWDDYDIIGDIHGHAQALHRLLDKLGYAREAQGYRHPNRKTLFVGDLIDRGPDQREVLETVRAMVDSGQARMVLGNHEFNAIGWYFRNSTDEPLRIHSEKNFAQHQTFLEAVGADSPLHREWVEWFMTLPLWLKLDELNLVHACWCSAAMQALTPYLNPDHTLKRECLEPLFTKGHSAYEAAEVLLKGPEIELPNQASFTDKDGHVRDTSRIKWWLKQGTLREVTLVPEEQEAFVLPQLPDQDMSNELHRAARLNRPTFIGHYWLHGEPKRLSEHVVCLDYSIAKGGKLVAYRHDACGSLSEAGFVATC